MTVVALPRYYGPKVPAHFARRVAYRRRPVAPVVALPVRSDAGRAYSLYMAGTAIDETDVLAAIELYERAITLDPKLALAMTNLANCHFRQGRVHVARCLYERALQLEPTQPEANYNLGYLSLQDGDMNVAIRLLEVALASDPNFADAWFNLGMAHEQRLGTHRSPVVHRCFSRYLKLAGNDPEYAAMARRRLG